MLCLCYRLKLDAIFGHFLSSANSFRNACIVVASGDPWIRAAKNATKTIPIVMMGVGSDPVRAGFVESLARPGGNVTGLTALNTELGGKRLELLKEAVPKLVRVAVLYDPADPPGLHEVKELLPADAHALKLTIQPWEIRAGKIWRAYHRACC
jgi:putative tryptophan/tyrosine transport system substrate-binding protein